MFKLMQDFHPNVQCKAEWVYWYNIIDIFKIVGGVAQLAKAFDSEFQVAEFKSPKSEAMFVRESGSLT